MRDGWNVAVEVPDAPVGPVGWADTSHLPKLELQGTSDAIDAAAPSPLSFSTAMRHDGAWWCRLTETRALVIGARPALEAPRASTPSTSPRTSPSLTLTGPLARETFARFCALDLRPAVTPVAALRPGSIGRQPGILIREAEDRYLFLFGWATGEYMWSVRRRRRRASRRRRDRRSTRLAERSMLDIFRKRRMWRRQSELKSSYDVVIVGGGSHGLATAHYLREHGITNVAILEKRYIGSGAAGRNTTILRSNYKTPEGARFYDASVKLYEGLSQDLNFNLLFSQCGHLTLAHADRAMFVMANRAEVNRIQGIDSRLIYPDEIKELAPAMQVDNPNATYPILGALYHPPGGIIRHDAVVWGLARSADQGGAEIHQNTEVLGMERVGQPDHQGQDQPRHDQRRPGAQLHRRLEHADQRHGGRAAADHHPHPAGVRDRADEAAAGRRDRLLADARLHLADRPRRIPDGRRDRAVDDVPDAGHAELPAGRLAATRWSCSRSWSGRGCCAAGPGCATSAPTTARSSARPTSRTSTSRRAGAPMASRRRRSSARRWPSWWPPAASRI